MKVYTLVNRKKVKIARNNDDFVSSMRKGDFEKWQNNEEFMKAYSYRKLVFEKIHKNRIVYHGFIRSRQFYSMLIKFPEKINKCSSYCFVNIPTDTYIRKKTYNLFFLFIT